KEPPDAETIKLARAALEEGEKVAPSDPYVVAQMFKLAVLEKDWAAAEKYCEREAKSNTDGTRGRIRRGRLEMARGGLAKAIQYYREGLAEYRSNSVGWSLLASAYMVNNQRAEARAALEQHALKLDPGNSDANRMMAALMIDSGDRRGAKPYLDAAAKTIPDDPFIRDQLQQLAEEKDPAAG